MIAAPYVADAAAPIPAQVQTPAPSAYIVSDKVKTALEENKQDHPPAVKDTQEYKDLKKEYEDYKAGVTAKETKAAKETAARAYYESKGITGKALDIAMRGSGAEIETLELADGKIKDSTALEALVKGDFAGLVNTTTTTGANTATPPANGDGDKKDAPNTRAAIIAAQYHANLYGENKKE